MSTSSHTSEGISHLKLDQRKQALIGFQTIIYWSESRRHESSDPTWTSPVWQSQRSRLIISFKRQMISNPQQTTQHRTMPDLNENTKLLLKEPIIDNNSNIRKSLRNTLYRLRSNQQSRSEDDAGDAWKARLPTNHTSDSSHLITERINDKPANNPQAYVPSNHSTAASSCVQTGNRSSLRSLISRPRQSWPVHSSVPERSVAENKATAHGIEERGRCGSVVEMSHCGGSDYYWLGHLTKTRRLSSLFRRSWRMFVDVAHWLWQSVDGRSSFWL